MSKYGPASSYLYVNGYDISSDTFTLDETIEQVLEESHGLGENWEKQYPVQLAKVMLEASGGLYDDATIGAALQESNIANLALRVVDYGMNGNGLGKTVSMLNGSYAATWKRVASRDALTKANAVHTITGDHRRGVVLHSSNAETTSSGNNQSTPQDRATEALAPASIAITSSSVANPTVITTPVAHGLTTGDIILITGHGASTPSLNGGNGYAVTVTGTFTFTIPVNVSSGSTGGSFVVVSSRGGNADLQMLALTLGGFTNSVIKVRHSIDNSTWTDLATFTARTAIGAERIVIPAGTLINRWTAISWAYGGAGSGQTVTPFVALNRN